MNRFLIGMHGGYDFKKFKRDFRKDFYGIEVCLFKDEDIDILKAESNKYNFNYGIHFPLRSGLSKVRDAEFLSLDSEKKESSYKRIEDELKFIKERNLEPKYILFHFPKPAIINENFNFNNWKFSDESEYEFEKNYNFERFMKNTEYLLKWLSQKSEEFNFIPVLEFDALNKYILKRNDFDLLIQKYDKVKLCLDVGRIYIQSISNNDFNALSFIKRFAKYAEIIHLWNFKFGEEGYNYAHYPVLPELKESEGWAPIKEYLKIIKEENPDVKVLFEHKSDLINDEKLEECYKWVEKLV